MGLIRFIQVRIHDVRMRKRCREELIRLESRIQSVQTVYDALDKSALKFDMYIVASKPFVGTFAANLYEEDLLGIRGTLLPMLQERLLSLASEHNQVTRELERYTWFHD